MHCRELPPAPGPAAARPRQNRMKVVLLGPFPPPHGGVQTNLVAIREYLRHSGHSCDVINLTRFRREDGDGVYYPAGAAALMRLLWQLPADIVHLHFGGDSDPAPDRPCAVLFDSAGAQNRAHLPFRRLPRLPRRPDGRARHVARIRPPPAGWLDRRQRRNRRPVRKIRRAQAAHPYHSPVLCAAAGPLPANARTARGVSRRTHACIADGRRPGARVRLANAD